MNYSNRKSAFTSLILLLFYGVTFSQESILDPKAPLGPVRYKKVLNQQFTNILTGQSKNSIGNFASLDLKETSVSVAGTNIFKNNSILTVKASGGVTDGLFAIFNNSKFNTNVAIDVQYNFLNPRNRGLTYYEESKEAYFRRLNHLQYQYSFDSLSVANDAVAKLYAAKRAELVLLADAQEKKIEREAVGSKKDSLMYENAKIRLQIDTLTQTIGYLPPKANAIYLLHISRNEQIKSATLDLKLFDFTTDWFSVGYKVSKNEFKLFDSARAFPAQVSDTNFVTHELRFQYSFYHWSTLRYKSFFFDAGVGFSYSDNFSSLTKNELTESRQFGAEPGARTLNKKYDAYSGGYLSQLKGFRFYADYFKFLFTNNIAAIHVYPEFKALDKEKPVWNLGVGFLLALKDAKDEKSVVNVELYYNIADLFNSSDSKYRIYERNSIGLRFTTPITFKQ